MTRLGRIQGKIAGPQGSAITEPSGSRLGKFLATGLRGELVALPALGPAYVQLAGHDAMNDIEGATFREMEGLALAPNAWSGGTYDRERARRTLAFAVRDPDYHDQAFGTVEEWGLVDEDLVTACYVVYGDVRYRLDPMGSDTLTDEDMRAISDALEKKNPMALRLFGVAKLSLFMLSTASLRASSRTHPSTDGPSSPE